MTIISNTGAYSAGNPYETQGERVSSASALSSAIKNSKGETSNPMDGVKVSLSKDVETARLRESMGLNPTGKLKFNDFKSVSESKEKSIKARLDKMMEKLGIDKKQKISINFDSDSNLSISESFKGKAKLQKAINADKAFKAEFKQLGTNSQIVNFTKKLTSDRPNLADFMNKNTDWNSIMTIASKYEELKAGGNSLASLVNLSSKEAPFTYVHGEGKE